MNEEILYEAINDIQSGAAICFVGAGFSMEAKDAMENPVPSVSMLCEEICKFPGLQGEVGALLTDLAEFCESNNSLKHALRALLLQRLTLTKPSENQRKILGMPWRAVFTTNFDDVAEVALGNAKVTVVTPTFNIKNLKPGGTALYYLHGRAKDMLDGAVDPSIIISESNYLDLKERNRDLYAALENEVHAASRIFFIGYSVRDAEIASRLFSIKGIQKKSIVICGQGEGGVSLNRLRKFGEVYAVGTEGFAKMLPGPNDSMARSQSSSHLSYVKRVSPVDAKSDVELADVEKLILAGEFSYSAYARQERDTYQTPFYCIPRRKHVDTVFSLANVNRFVVSSDLGNGKSVFLDQVIFHAHGLGYEVFRVDTQLPEALIELDKLLETPNRRLYVVDGLVRYKKVVKHIGKRLLGNSILLVTAGQYLEESMYGELNEELGGITREIDLNILSNDELVHWDGYLERWGYWEDRIEETADERVQFLKERCGAENRSIVISLFRETRLSRKIDSIVEFFLKQNGQFSRAFVAVLINSLCQKHVDWSRIVDWLNIDEIEFKKTVIKSPIGDFMTGSRRWFEFTSTELADHILNSYDFITEEIVDVYTTIVRQTAYSANDPRSGFDARENLKELMRFRFLTRLFSRQSEGAASINSVYHRLSNVPRIRTNDQFWLQYAMARMEVGDLENAETYLSTAIGLANKKGLEYSKRQILDQRARLLLRKCTKKLRESEVEEVIGLLTDLLLERNEPVVHPLRSAEHMLAFLEAKADELKPNMVEDLKNLMKLMRSKIPEGRLDKSQKGETEFIRKTVRDSLLILSNL